MIFDHRGRYLTIKLIDILIKGPDFVEKSGPWLQELLSTTV